MTALQAEAERQAALLQALLAPRPPSSVPVGWATLPGRGATPAAGLQAYRGNAAAHAARALAEAHPVFAQLVGEEAMAALAWRLWCEQPPRHGDLGEWGGGLAGLVATLPELADDAYLPDVARLDWCVHQAARAADAAAAEAVPGLDLLSSHAPEALQLRFTPGLAVLVSAFPIVSIWQAHQPTEAGQPEDQRFAAVRAGLAQGRGEAALVVRQGWAVQVRQLPTADAAFTAALRAGQTLGQALAGTPPEDFTAWLVSALQAGWLQAIQATYKGTSSS